MGLGFFKHRQEMTRPQQAEMGSTNERFGAYFPRLFAYVRSCVGGDMPTQDICVDAFKGKGLRRFFGGGLPGEKAGKQVMGGREKPVI